MGLNVNVSNWNTFFKAYDFLSVEETDKKFEHIGPHHIGDISHQLPDLMRHVRSKVLFDHLNQFT